MRDIDIKETKRNKILEAAYQLFIKNGYKNTKIIDIAVAAGIGKGTVYEYFESKETLLLNILSGGVEDYLEKCQLVLASQKSHIDKLLEVIMLEAEYARESGPRLMKMTQWLIDANDGLPDELLNKMYKIWLEKYSFVKQILVGGVEGGEFREMNTDLVAVTVMGATGSYLQMKYGLCQFEDIKLPFDVEKFKKNELVDFLLKGIQV